MFLNEGINVKYMFVGFFHNIKLGFFLKTLKLYEKIPFRFQCKNMYFKQLACFHIVPYIKQIREQKVNYSKIGDEKMRLRSNM
jgi:hypothetical protein